MKPITYPFFLLLLVTAIAYAPLQGQAPDWQQQADYVMEVSLNTDTHILQGKQQLTYYNNSPDTLRRVYYHLYFNAFQTGSMMEVFARSRASTRVGDRIFSLKDDESGYQRVHALTQADQALSFRIEGTILVVDLNTALLPGTHTNLDMEFETRVPIQIRRSGRDSAEGIAYSMSQWYPKIAEYDHRGWHATPYIGREFHGVWGNFDVTIEIDPAFVVAATGLLQEPEKIGKGYSTESPENNDTPLRWRFIANKVHDFVWAADKNYIHDVIEVPDGPTLRFFYRENVQKTWKDMQPYAVQAFTYLNRHYGKYPYSQYCIIQGGDGGMEYPMATLITGERSFNSLVGVVVHEAIHSWYQGLLATNETLYAWMDEGFTTYASEVTMRHLFPEKKKEFMKSHYNSYARLNKAGEEEPLNTLADHYQINRAYWVGAYRKGAVFQHQLSYVVGEKAFARGLLRYFDTWKYRHPDPMDYIRVMEKESGIELDWYYEYFANTTHTIDYGIEDVTSSPTGGVRITLARVGAMPMPIDLVLTRKDGSEVLYHIPLRIMWGIKEKEGDMERRVMSAWPWTHPYYYFDIPDAWGDIARIEIDPSGRLADMVADNQVYSFTGKAKRKRSTQTLGMQGVLQE